MSAGFGPVVNPVDGVGPPGQWRIIGVEGALVVDVPQQVGPAALLGAVIMVVGGVAIADQHSGERLAQRFIHHRLAPTPPQEVAFGGGAESPHVAVGSALTPAGFVGVDHWAGADAVQDRGHCRLGPLRRAMDGAHDGPHGVGSHEKVFGLSESQIARRVKAIAKAAGLPDWELFSGHSGRVGMARRMAQNGAPTHEIERQGRWKQGGGMVGRYTRGESAGSALLYL